MYGTDLVRSVRSICFPSEISRYVVLLLLPYLFKYYSRENLIISVLASVELDSSAGLDLNIHL